LPDVRATEIVYIAISASIGSFMARPIIVHADWDPEAAVWVATTNDLRGLVTEADTIEALRAKLPGMILDLLEENAVSDLAP
jgi:predicted RNase H-like HicB family nuclease